MKKVGLFLVVAMILPLVFLTPMARAVTIAEGTGHFIFQTVDQNFIDPPPQWIIKYVRMGVNIDVGFQFYCSPAGTIEIRGPIDGDDGTWINMRFKTGGLVFRYNRFASYVVFNGVGSFCLYRPREEGEEPSIDNIIEGSQEDGGGGFEHGKASIIGKATYNPKTGIGRFVQTFIHGGNFGFLFRGLLNGTVRMYDQE